MQRWIGIIGLATAAGCAGGSEAQPRAEQQGSAQGSEEDVAAVVAGNTRFAARLHAQLAGEPGNLFHSPFSVSSALAMTLAGARGETARELREALALPPEPHAALGALLADLNGRRLEARYPDDPDAGARPFELSIANALWPQAGYPFEPAWLELVRADYGAEARALDFVNAAEPARLEINRWVEQRTDERIKDLLRAGDLTPDLRLVLTNAVYFKAAWQEPFVERVTQDAPFHLAGGELVEVPTMARTDSLASKETALLDVVRLPYRGGQASMVLLVPKAVDGLAEVEARLADELLGWTSDLRPAQIALSLPRFRFTSRFVLNDALKAMGVREAFRYPAADFTGISPTGELFLGFAIHQSFVAVDEQGTEAAAATALGLRAGSVPPPPRAVRVDRPFLFLIRDEPTGTILFMGRVADPRG